MVPPYSMEYKRLYSYPIRFRLSLIRQARRPAPNPRIRRMPDWQKKRVTIKDIALAAAVDPSTRLMVDANCGYSPARAIEVGRFLDDHGVVPGAGR